MYVYAPATSSGEKTASAQIATMPCLFHGLDIKAPATGVVTVKIWDSEDSSLSGKLLIGIFTCVAGQNGLSFASFLPRICNRGLYAEMTGTTTYVVGFSL